MLIIERSPAKVTWRIVFGDVIVFCHTQKNIVVEKAKELAKMFEMEVEER